jgi:hypothetical protein
VNDICIMYKLFHLWKAILINTVKLQNLQDPISVTSIQISNSISKTLLKKKPKRKISSIGNEDVILCHLVEKKTRVSLKKCYHTSNTEIYSSYNVQEIICESNHIFVVNYKRKVKR